MSQAFLIVLREGFESFLIVAITLSYLAKIRRLELFPAVYFGTLASIVTSVALGFWLWQGADGPLWEGIFGLVSAAFVTGLVIHMWRTAPHLKQDMEEKIRTKTQGRPGRAAFAGVFLFTVFMITREGMETAMLLIQIHEPRIVAGTLLGLLGTCAMAFLWMRCSALINLKRFFQVTSVFLLVFVLQILIYSFHEFTEAGIFPASDALHAATEPFSSDGLYGKWFSFVTIGASAFWLIGAWLRDRFLEPDSIPVVDPSADEQRRRLAE